MADQNTDIEALMARIRAEVKEESKNLSSTLPHYIPSNSYNSEIPLIHSEELSYLNEHWGNWENQNEITSHRRFVGPILVKIKEFFVNCIWDFVLRDYFEKERNFQRNLVKHLNHSAKYLDERVEKIFWQLIEKMDQDIKGLNDRADKLHFLAEGKAAGFENEVQEGLSALKLEIEKVKGTVESINSLSGAGSATGAGVISPLVIRDSIPPSWKSSLEELNQTIGQVNATLAKSVN